MADNKVGLTFTGEGSGAIAETKKVSAGIDGIGASAKQAGEQSEESFGLLHDSMAEISTLAREVGAEIKQLGHDILASIGTSVETSESRIKEATGAIGEHVKGVAEKTAVSAGAWYVWGAEGVAAVTLIFNAVGMLVLAYKSLDFAVGLLNGESYKSANIDALIATNKEVKELQDLLHLSAVDAGALNDALSRLGVNKADIAAVTNGVKSAPTANGDEMDRLGVTYKGAGGAVLADQTIVQNAKNVLDQYTEGWDRNQAAIAIGIGSYEQINNYLKVNQEELQRSKARLDDFNLGIGPESQQAIENYQAAMREFGNEQKLMGEGFSRAIADNVMPALTDLALFFKDGWPIVVNVFRYTMAEITTLFWGLKMDVDIVVDVIKGGFMSVGDIVIAAGKAAALALTGDFSGAADVLAKGWQDAKSRVGKTSAEIVKDAQHDAAAMKLAWGFDDRSDPAAGRPKKGKSFTTKPGDDEDETDTANSNYPQLVKAAHDAYLSYLKAYSEQRVAIIKSANALDIQINQSSYDQGLTDLQSYLATKHLLTEQSLQAELTAKQEELKNAQAAEKTAQDAYKTDPTGDAARNVNEAYAKVVTATTAVIDAQTKLTMAKRADTDETRKMTTDQLHAYQEIQAQLLDMQGQYVAAAQIRKGLDESSNARQALITEAMKGTAGAETAYWAQEALDQQKGNDAIKKAAAERAAITVSEISNQLALIDTAEKFYAISTGEAAQQRIVLLKQELTAQQAVYDSIQGNEPAAITARLQAQAAINGVNEKLLTQQKILSDRTASGGAISALHAIADQAQNLGAQVSGAVGDLFKGMEDALVSFVSKGKLDFKSLADSIVSDLIRIAIQQSATGPLSAGIGGFLQNMFSPAAGSAASGFGSNGVSLASAGAPAFSEISFIPQAMGGAWSNGVQKFATGGIVQSPTFFQTASGMGVMGEAGDEAIMPLTRTASGHLGVRASGGGQSAAQEVNVQVNVVNQSSQEVSAKQSGAPVFDGKQWIVGVVLENIINGGPLRAALQGEG
jgi:lambda family phage tail tape measure protein